MIELNMTEITSEESANSSSTHMMRRLPTGMRDWDKDLIKLREHVILTIKKFYSGRDAKQLDTPVLELFDIVKNLYGEEFDKSVYLLDDGDLIMRYDLTVPFARYIAMNGLDSFRRYQIGKVYRRDLPQIIKGRYTEITQADFDIAGSDQSSGMFDLEILELCRNVLLELIGDNFIIRLNSRDILLQYLKKMNIPENKLMVVAASIDKLDKKSVPDICLELIQKDISTDTVDVIEKFISSISKILDSHEKIISFLEINIPKETLLTFSKIYDLSINDICIELKKKGICDEIIDKVRKIDNTHKIVSSADILTYLMSQELITKETWEKFTIFLNRLNKLGISGIMFDPLLTRGLDYYTGIIFEVYYNDKEIMPSSICAGGRYDNLIGKFSNRGECPAVGMSIGIERIITILSNLTIKTKFKMALTSPIKIYIGSIGPKETAKDNKDLEIFEILDERIKLCNEFRKYNIPTKMSHLKNPKISSQLEDVLNNNIPYMVIIGQKEIKNKMIRVKTIADNLQQDFDRDVGIKFLVDKLK